MADMDSETLSREDRLVAALFYPFWPLALFYLNLRPDKRQVRFLRHHAYQAFFLGMALWLGGIAVNTAAAFLGKYLSPLGLLLYPFVKLLGLASLALTLYAAWTAWKGDYLELPYLTKVARPFVEEGLETEPEEATAESPGEAEEDRA